MIKLFDGTLVSPAELAVFTVLSLGTLFGALWTITRRNPVTAVMSLVATFFALAGLYATLSAHFLAVLQILVYAGAIMVLFIFVVMILNREEISPISWAPVSLVWRLFGLLCGLYVAYLGAWVVARDRLSSAVLNVPKAPLPPDYGTVGGVGLSLFRDFMFPFEAISLLLLVAIVGGVIVSRSHRQEERAQETVRRLREIRLKGGEHGEEPPLLSDAAHH
jgi:NADH-quinone oxidoreductase subunit J